MVMAMIILPSWVMQVTSRSFKPFRYSIAGESSLKAKDLLPNDVQQGWDGTSRGKPADEGTYVYVAKVVLLNDKVKTLTGDILLNR